MSNEFLRPESQPIAPGALLTDARPAFSRVNHSARTTSSPVSLSERAVVRLKSQGLCRISAARWLRENLTPRRVDMVSDVGLRDVMRRMLK
jgi:hypothetical protein